MTTGFVGSRRVAVVCTDDGNYHAVRDVCPHQGVALSEGRLERCWEGDRAGDYRAGDTFNLVCPWHNFEFDVATGLPPYSSRRLRVKAYRVEVEYGELVVYT